MATEAFSAMENTKSLVVYKYSEKMLHTVNGILKRRSMLSCAALNMARDGGKCDQCGNTVKAPPLEQALPRRLRTWRVNTSLLSNCR